MGTSAIPRRKLRTLSALLAIVVGGAVAMAVWPLNTADASIAGVKRILNANDQVLDANSKSCDLGKYCITYPLTLQSGQVIQAQVNNPTSGVTVGLYDEFGNEVTSTYVDGGDSDWINAAVESSGHSKLGLDSVTSPGKHSLVVGSDNKQHFSLYAFTIPDHLKMVSSSATVKGEFNKHTTRQISGKYTNYWDGVVFNGRKGASFSVHFNKPADDEATVGLYDSFQNELKESSGTNSAAIKNYKLPYTGLYEIVIQGESQGKFTLTLDEAKPIVPCNPYPDVTRSNPHCYNIKWLKHQGITKPADGLYHPKGTVTRGSMTAFLFRLSHPGKPSPRCTKRPFPDVSVSSTFCGYVKWAANNGIAYGYSNGTFGPGKAVTRGAMAAFLKRIATDRPTPTCTKKPFNDVGVNDVFCGVITWMKNNHITYGVGNGSKYGTRLKVTRQSMASFLHRVADL